MEEQSKQSEEAKRLKAIFEFSQDGIITIDRRGSIESINPAAAKLFGYEPKEVIGHNINMLMPEPYHGEHDGYMGNYHRTGKKKIIGIGREVEGKRKDGSVFPFFLSVSEVKLENETIYTGFIHDVSEIKKKEKDLEISRQRLNAIFDTAVDGIIIIDRKGIIQMVNPAVSKLFGYDDLEMIGNNIKMLMPEPDHSAHGSYLDNYHKTRKPKIIGIGREVEGLRKDGSQFPFNLGVSEVQTDNGVLYTGIIHDLSTRKKIEDDLKSLNISLEEKVAARTTELTSTVNKLLSTNKKMENEVTERKKAEAALLTSLEKEQQLNELKSRFVSMASHEFRTPLSTILSSSALIGRYTEGEQQDKREKHINRIKSSVSNLTGILNDFLSISKLEEGKIENQVEEFDFEVLCTEVKDEIQGLLKAGQTISHQSKLPESLVIMDKRLMKNILFNLVSNAIKYSPEGKPIICIISFEKGNYIVQVKDQGIGIPEEDKKYMFSRFFRATNSTNIQGTGLGLNIVQQYARLMGGELSFESKEGKGSIFTVKIPKK